MGASNFAGLAIPKPEPHKRSKGRAERAQAKADRLVYQHVNQRDGLRCRACGVYAGIDAHRHHLVSKKITTPEAVCCVCEECHDCLHVRVGGKLMQLSGDAEARDRFGRLCGLVLEVRQNDGSWRVETGL